jgi:hypothetical protein
MRECAETVRAVDDECLRSKTGYPSNGTFRVVIQQQFVVQVKNMNMLYCNNRIGFARSILVTNTYSIDPVTSYNKECLSCKHAT